LIERIRADGPISVEAYMEACNAFYYATRDPLGRDGDFTTAPEISQMFGELVGAALADCWTKVGQPANAIYAELGPGRGTLASDTLRVLRSAGFAGDVHLVETSPVLRKTQAKAVPCAIWHESIEDMPAAPLLLVANEFFDALPVRQTVAGLERHVEVIGGALAFDRDGEIEEASPARAQAMLEVSTCIAQCGGVGLIVDYGHERSAPCDTLQAVRGHRYVPVLTDPGEQDLTAHVDFEALGDVAREAGARVTEVVAQGDWLNRLGIGARAAALATSNPERVPDLEKAVDRLCHEEQMGQLFKVMAVYSPGWPAPAGFTQ
jgi:NADH dehydrogenase [ubiquinone] 1 alpha subcomplex assembly factor 7